MSGNLTFATSLLCLLPVGSYGPKFPAVQHRIWWPIMIPTKDFNLLIIRLTFTAGRDGKDGRDHIVQSFPLFSIEFGGLL
jgi:hypothetical protein